MNKKLKKSHRLLIGSLLVFGGIISLSWNYLLRMSDEVYSDMKIAMMENHMVDDTVVVNEEVKNIDNNDTGTPVYYEETIDYSWYLGVLEIPKIQLKRGFYNVGNRYNDIYYNIALINGSNMPDVVNGNLLLMGHSGNSYNAYFHNLYLLGVGDDVYVTYNSYKYHYKIVNIYVVPKVGVVNVERNKNRTTLTMITCTRNDDYSQTVYIAERVDY